jgi:hypothetical protein
MVITTSMSNHAIASFIVPARLNPDAAAALPDDAENDAARFVSLLTEGGAATFQTFDDTPAKRKLLATIRHGSIEKYATHLTRLNERGAGVFLMVNRGDGRGRRTANVTAVRALFVDLDGAPLEPVMAAPIQPHLVVETSPGRWHAYWLVDGVPLESFSHLQVQLAKMFNADPSVKDVCRVMRVPGFLHRKSTPWRSRLISVREGPRIAVQAFIDAFRISPIIPVGERNTNLFKAASGLRQAGIPKASAEARIAKMNMAATASPVEAAEVTAIVANAYGYEARGFSMVPHALIDTPEFDDLSGAAAKLFLYALRRHLPSKDFALPHSEFKHIAGLKNRKQFRAALEELILARFLAMTRNYVAGAVCQDRRCALYCIGDRLITYLSPNAA